MLLFDDDKWCGNGASVSGPDSNLYFSREHAERPYSRNSGGMLRPGNQAQLVRLHQAGMRGDHANAKPVSAAFSRRNAALVNVIAIPVGLAAFI